MEQTAGGGPAGLVMRCLGGPFHLTSGALGSCAIYRARARRTEMSSGGDGRRHWSSTCETHGARCGATGSPDAVTREGVAKAARFAMNSGFLAYSLGRLPVTRAGVSRRPSGALLGADPCHSEA